MAFEESVFHWRSSSISYRSFGEGQTLMIAFHGFDQNNKAFDVFESALSSNYSVVSIDLPHQGNTVWREDELSAEMLKLLINDFLTHLNYSGKVCLMAYSLGGNYALGIAINSPQLVDELWLIAADGLKDKPAFRFLTKTVLGNKMFLLFVKSARLIKLATVLAKTLRILPSHVANYYLESISTKSKRAELRNRWISSSRIVPLQKETFRVLNSNKINVKMLFGSHDNIIPIQNAYKFKKHVPKAQLKVLEQGHNLLKIKNCDAILELSRNDVNQQDDKN